VQGRHPPTVLAGSHRPIASALEDRIPTELATVTNEGVKAIAQEAWMTIFGARKFKMAAKDRKYHRMDRTCGNCWRSSLLAEDANPAKVRAEFEGGVLIVHLVREAKAQLEQIAVKVA
jgi:HSP20 family molecular chaperone IbpA